MNIITQQKGLHGSIRKCTDIVTNTQTDCYKTHSLISLYTVRRPKGLKTTQRIEKRATMNPGKDVELEVNSLIIDGTNSFSTIPRGVEYAR